MNIQALKKNVGWWVRFRPEARGLTIPDSEWYIESVNEQSKKVRISLPATGHFVELEGDHIHSFMRDTQRRGPDRSYCYIILRVELTVEGYSVHQEPLPPNRPGISKWTTEDKVIDETYIQKSDLRQRWTALRWSNREKAAGLEAVGYRQVTEEDRVRRVEYRLVRHGQVLVGKKLAGL